MMSRGAADRRGGRSSAAGCDLLDALSDPLQGFETHQAMVVEVDIEMALLAAYRGRGIGGRLLDRLIARKSGRRS